MVLGWFLAFLANLSVRNFLLSSRGSIFKWIYVCLYFMLGIMIFRFHYLGISTKAGYYSYKLEPLMVLLYDHWAVDIPSQLISKYWPKDFILGHQLNVFILELHFGCKLVFFLVYLIVIIFVFALLSFMRWSWDHWSRKHIW